MFRIFVRNRFGKNEQRVSVDTYFDILLFTPAVSLSVQSDMSTCITLFGVRFFPAMSIPKRI